MHLLVWTKGRGKEEIKYGGEWRWWWSGEVKAEGRWVRCSSEGWGMAWEERREKIIKEKERIRKVGVQRTKAMNGWEDSAVGWGRCMSPMVADVVVGGRGGVIWGRIWGWGSFPWGWWVEEVCWRWFKSDKTCYVKKFWKWEENNENFLNGRKWWNGVEGVLDMLVSVLSNLFCKGKFKSYPRWHKIFLRAII